MRFITHEAVSALAQYDNPFRAGERKDKLDAAIATLPPDEQKAIVKHFVVRACGPLDYGCDHGDALGEGLRSLSHYYPTPARDRPDLRRE